MDIHLNMDRHSEKLDQMIQIAVRGEPDKFLCRKNEIIDFIMANPDLPIKYDQIVFILRSTSPSIGQYRKDYYDVLSRLVSEAKLQDNMTLVKSIYLSIPFYPDDKDYQQKQAFMQTGIEFFISRGAYQAVGELYVRLAATHRNTTERIQFCDKALEFLDQTSKEYACTLAKRKMLSHMDRQKNEECLQYGCFGEMIFRKEQIVFLSPIFHGYSFYKAEEFLCIDAAVLKGNYKLYTLTSLEGSGYNKEIVDETLSVGASKPLPDEKELIRYPDEKLICQVDGREYLCHVFSIKQLKKYENIIGAAVETNYFADGIGLIRTVLSVDDRNYVYDLCEYSIKGGSGMLPCCVGNRWSYKQENCPDYIDQVIKREIIAQKGEEYLLSGWNYAGENPF